MVGSIPLFAITPLEPAVLDKLPNFKKRLEWFIRHRSDLKRNVACMETGGVGARRLLALCYVTPGWFNPEDKFRRILIKLFGGNSNWRGFIWMLVNYLLIESLQQFHGYVGNDFKIQCPTGSDNWMTLKEVANELSMRLVRLLLRDSSGHRPLYGGTEKFQPDPYWRDLLLFPEYFHGDNGAGIGASHQTGWTGLVANLIQQLAEEKPSHPVSEMPELAVMG